MQCACAILSSGLPGSTEFFPNFLINGTIFKKKKFLNTNCVFRFSLQVLSETFLILRRNERDMIKMCIGIHVKHPLFFFRF